MTSRSGAVMRRTLRAVMIATLCFSGLTVVWPIDGQESPTSALPAFRGGGPLTGVAPDIAPPPYTVRWNVKTSEEERAGVEGAPAIAGEIVYIADDRGDLHALSLANGKEKWVYKSGDSFATSPLILNGRVYLGD